MTIRAIIGVRIPPERERLQSHGYGASSNGSRRKFAGRGANPFIAAAEPIKPASHGARVS